MSLITMAGARTWISATAAATEPTPTTSTPGSRESPATTDFRSNGSSSTMSTRAAP